MKKLMMTLAAGLFATAVVAQVTSGNIVGYSTITIPSNQWTMIGLQFDQVGDTNGIPVQDVFVNPATSGFMGGGNQASADNLMFWDTGINNYVTLYLFTSTATTGANATRKNKWRNPGSVPSTALWGPTGEPSQYKVMPGQGFWVKRVAGSYVNSNITATVSGQVVTGGKSRVITEGWNLIAGSFTSPFTPNPDIAGTGPAIDWPAMGAAGGGNQASADNLMFWDTGINNYVTLYLFTSTATTGANATRKNKWRNPGSVPSTVVWGPTGEPSKYQAPLGNQGFWYKRLVGKGTFNLTEAQPYTLD